VTDMPPGFELDDGGNDMIPDSIPQPRFFMNAEQARKVNQQKGSHHCSFRLPNEIWQHAKSLVGELPGINSLTDLYTAFIWTGIEDAYNCGYPDGMDGLLRIQARLINRAVERNIRQEMFVNIQTEYRAIVFTERRSAPLLVLLSDIEGMFSYDQNLMPEAMLNELGRMGEVVRERIREIRVSG